MSGRLLRAIVVAVALSGCGGSRSTPVARSGMVRYTDMVGRTVELTRDIRRIVIARTMDIYKMAAILGSDLDETLIAVGTSFAQGDIDGYRKFREVFPHLDGMVTIGSVYDDTLSLETVVGLRPDIVIVDKQFQTVPGVGKMIEAGLPVVFTDTISDPFHGAQRSMQMLGRMLGREERVNEMATYAIDRTDAVLKRVAERRSSTAGMPRLYFEVGDVDPAQVGVSRGGTKDGWGFLWHALGADNIAVNNGNGVLNPERVLVADPDVIVIGGANWNADGNIMRLGFFAAPADARAHLSLYARRPGWRELAAIKNGRLHAIHFNYFVHPFNFVGVEEMARFLYPEEFADLKPERDLREFFRLYMPVAYSGVFSVDWHGPQRTIASARANRRPSYPRSHSGTGIAR